MIGAATFMFVSHMHRATTGPMMAPRPVERSIRTTPVRTTPPLPPQLFYPRSSGGSAAERRFAVEPPVVTPVPGRGWEADRYEPRMGREGRERMGSGWRED
jgi:hypothetical protein